VRLLLYGYATGVYSSRRIQTRTFDDLAFRYLSGDQHPDHATIAEFRKRHLDALSGLFTQALLLCSQAGLVKLGHVAIDGTKIKAYASKHKAMSYKRMNETEARLKQEIDALLAAAEQTDAEEDAQHGKDRHGDELPIELQQRESRLQKIREAKAALEQEAKEKAEQQRAETEQNWPNANKKSVARARRSVAASRKRPIPSRPSQKAQRNATSSIRRAVSCRTEPTRAASCKVTTRRSRSTPRRR
jgi:flagellar biosynthesis GTPase FlhF